MRVLIDGDILCYSNSSAVERPIDWGDDFWTLHADFQEAKQKSDIDIVEFVERLGGTSFTVCLSDRTRNFRQELSSDYKGNRKDLRKPVCYAPLYQYIRTTWNAVVWSGLEADDVMGIMATGPEPCIIVSADKDMRTIPGRIYNPGNPDAGIIEVSLAEANRNHLIQTLSGDRVDGYPGCPGVGAVRAARIAEGGWDAVVAAYVKAGQTEEDALLNARLAYILRRGDYEKKTGEVRLWRP